MKPPVCLKRAFCLLCLRLLCAWLARSCRRVALARRLVKLPNMFAVLLALLAASSSALEIVISEGWESPSRIAVVPFGGAPLRDRIGPVEAVDIAGIVSFDLARSGQFDSLSSDKMLSHPSTIEEVSYRDWRILDMDYVVIGRSWAEADGNVTILYQLLDANSEREIATARWSVPSSRIRDVAHAISDAVYEAVTGIRGAFSTKLLYVVVQNQGLPNASYRLLIADADGARERTVFQSSQPILSPSWAPEARRIAYVSFETGRSTIVLQDLDSGARRTVAEYPGINGAPMFSPDGSRLAMSLSRDGNSEIYVKDIEGGELQRITRRPSAIDTEPVWSPDGESLIYTSDRGGRPQIYRQSLDTLYAERLTFSGDYNARARLLPGGQHLVYVHRSNGVYHIAWQDLERDTVRVLTETALDESPSLAPNGTMMIYATQTGGRGILAVVSIDGRVKYMLPSASGDVREPAWSPFIDALPASAS